MTPTSGHRVRASLLLACLLGAAQAQGPTRWVAVEPGAALPLSAAQAASWPEAVQVIPAPTRSLGVLFGLLQPKPPAETPHWPDAASLPGRVAEAVQGAAPSAYARAADGHFVEQAGRDDAAQALADTIATALHQAGHGPRAAPAERLASEARGLLRALHEDRALDEARQLSLARRAAGPGAPAEARPATLADVEGVRLLETPSQPTTLWVLLKPAASRPQGLVARVNLDDVLARVSRRGH